MQDIDNGLRDISQIRSMMEAATKFLSLSGLSGISAGLVALGGAWIAARLLGSGEESTEQWLVMLPFAIFMGIYMAQRGVLPGLVLCSFNCLLASLSMAEVWSWQTGQTGMRPLKL